MTATTAAARPGEGVSAPPQPVIDCDVHVTWAKLEELLPYLPKVWHNRLLQGSGHVGRGVYIHPNFYSPHRGTHKEAATSAAGGVPGSDPATVVNDWLDRHSIAHAVLNHHDMPIICTWGDIDYPVAIARAYNDWLVEHWLSHTPRFLGSIVVAAQDPRAAAEEIDRVGGHPQVVQVLLASAARDPYGVRTFHPIYEAAERNGLTIALHTGTEGNGRSNPPTAAGWPSSYLEWWACQPQNLAAHITSLVTEGTFVTFPKLRFVLLESGAAWAAPFLWRLDKNWKGLRSECPWLKEPPSAYVRRHFRFGTQGLERAGDPDDLWLYLDEMGAAETLVYTSNYPRWDLEPPSETPVLCGAAPHVQRRIAFDNARDLYGIAVVDTVGTKGGRP